MKAYFKIINILVVILFMGMLLLPWLNNNFHFIKEEEAKENRVKAGKPAFNDTLVEQYFKDYDSYYTDNFNLRDNFITLLNKFQLAAFNVSSVPSRVTIGKDGWFYEASCAFNYKGANLFTDSEMVAYRAELIKRTLWAKRRGIKYYLVIVPNKMHVYPEHLPYQVIKVSDISRYDQVAQLNNDSTINVIDLRKNLLPHKNDGYDIYQHTDDHWNELGAYYGYQEIMNRLSNDFPELKPIPLDDFQIEIIERAGNMAQLLNVDKEYPEHFVALREKFQTGAHEGTKRGYTAPPEVEQAECENVTENENKNLKVLIIRDSFTLFMLKFLQEHFKSMVVIHDAWMYRMREDLILKEKPDIILNVVLETNLFNIIQIPFKLKADQELERDINIIAPNGKYICTEPDHLLRANRNEPSSWEKFTFITYDKGECAFLAYSNSFVAADLGGKGEIVAQSEKVSDWERFKLIKLDDGFVALQASNGKYMSLDESTLRLYANSDAINKNTKFKLADKK
jgi:alginate O-acetyltransferase complex protein AlgJ